MNKFLDPTNRTILAVVWKDLVTDKLDFSMRDLNEFGYIQEFSERVDEMQVSQNYYSLTLGQNQSYNLSVLNYYNTEDVGNTFTQYEDAIDFRFLKIFGPISADVAECIKFTFMLTMEEVTRMNYYCYDPLTARYTCQQIRADLIPRRLQVSAPEPEYLDDRD
jgi:hypothetical protein